MVGAFRARQQLVSMLRVFLIASAVFSGGSATHDVLA
jgi:hypothetical protein